MSFNYKFLEEYQNLIQNTNLQKGYQEFIRLFRWLRINLQNRFSSFRFQGNIVENNMEYSYFQFSDDTLKQMGLKIVVVFVHSDFRFEIWISGCNRQVGRGLVGTGDDLFDGLQSLPVFLTPDPDHLDYIVKFPIEANPAHIDCDALLDMVSDTCVQAIHLVNENLKME